VAIADGGQLGLSGGGTVIRKANVYYVLAPSGDSLTATVWPGPWINLSVGLGRWPSKVRGLLANANGKVNEIETSEGQVLTIPLSFNTLYGHFTDSWRVASNQSMLSACGASDLRGIKRVLGDGVIVVTLEADRRRKCAFVCRPSHRGGTVLCN
jgi:hypothetical protein